MDDQHRFKQFPEREAVPPRFIRAVQNVADQLDLLGADDDTAMREAVHKHFGTFVHAPRVHHRSRSRWIAVGSAVAACIGIVSTVIFITQQPAALPTKQSSLPTIATATITGDFDGNGHIDILDALGLARALETGWENLQLDLNHDGNVDVADVDAIAAIAVSLDVDADADADKVQAG